MATDWLAGLGAGLLSFGNSMQREQEKEEFKLQQEEEQKRLARAQRQKDDLEVTKLKIAREGTESDKAEALKNEIAKEERAFAEQRRKEAHSEKMQSIKDSAAHARARLKESGADARAKRKGGAVSPPKPYRIDTEDDVAALDPFTGKELWRKSKASSDNDPLGYRSYLNKK